MRHLGIRDKGENSVRTEDEITSLVFGPLEYMDKRLSAYFWHYLLSELGTPITSSSPPLDCTIDFWPKDGIEPDMTVTLKYSDGETVFLLIEIKWDADLSKRQLQKQWQTFTEDKISHATCYHLFLAKETRKGRKAQEDDDVWGDKLLFLTWYQLSSIMNKLQRSDHTKHSSWLAQVVTFLEFINVRGFRGFHRTEEIFANTGILASIRKHLFWYGFKGFFHIETHIQTPINRATIFFRG